MGSGGSFAEFLEGRQLSVLLPQIWQCKTICNLILLHFENYRQQEATILSLSMNIVCQLKGSIFFQVIRDFGGYTLLFFGKPGKSRAHFVSSIYFVSIFLCGWYQNVPRAPIADSI